MDLAIGAKDVYVMTEPAHQGRRAQARRRLQLSPHGCVGCVSRVYTDHGVFDVTPDGFRVRELFGDNTHEEIESLLGLSLEA